MPTTRRTSFNRNPSSLSSNATFACAFRGRHLDSPEKLSTFLGTQLPVSRVHCRVPILLRVLTSFLPFSSVYSVSSTYKVSPLILVSGLLSLVHEILSTSVQLRKGCSNEIE